MKIWHNLIIVQVLAHALGQTSMQLFSFQMVDSDNKSGVTPGLSASLVTRCAISCCQMSLPCYSFSYDEETSACTSGASIKDGRAPVSPFQGYLFSSIVCAKPGYTLHIHQDTVMCLRLSTKKLNYTNARLACQAEGSHLLTLKTEDKLRLFTEAQSPGNGQTWVGLNDMDSEGVFQWVDDGSVVTPDFQKQLFGEGQPDNDFSNHDCCVYEKEYFPLNDTGCDKVLLYFCESVPTFVSTQSYT